MRYSVETREKSTLKAMDFYHLQEYFLTTAITS